MVERIIGTQALLAQLGFRPCLAPASLLSPPPSPTRCTGFRALPWAFGPAASPQPPHSRLHLLSRTVCTGDARFSQRIRCCGHSARCLPCRPVLSMPIRTRSSQLPPTTILPLFCHSLSPTSRAASSAEPKYLRLQKVRMAPLHGDTFNMAQCNIVLHGLASGKCTCPKQPHHVRCCCSHGGLASPAHATGQPSQQALTRRSIRPGRAHSPRHSRACCVRSVGTHST